MDEEHTPEERYDAARNDFQKANVRSWGSGTQLIQNARDMAVAVHHETLALRDMIASLDARLAALIGDDGNG